MKLLFLPVLVLLPLITTAPLIAVDALPVDDPIARAALPEFHIIPAATTAELTPAQNWPTTDDYRNWSRSLGGPTANRYSSLTQITSANVKQLQVAWTYQSGDGKDNIQCNPIMVDGVLYTPTPGRQIAAIDAKTGKELWKADVGLAKAGGYEVPARRGLLYWPGTNSIKPRLYFPGGNQVIAIDAKTGARVSDFGTNGAVKLPAGSTAGGVVWQNVLIIPKICTDLMSLLANTYGPLIQFRWQAKWAATPGSMVAQKMRRIAGAVSRSMNHAASSISPPVHQNRISTALVT